MTTYCLVDPCDRVRWNRETGYCQMHHRRHLRGIPLDAPKWPRGLQFETHFVKAAPDECWEWQSYISEQGYGRYGRINAHRISHERWVGPIPAGFHIDHLCRNRKCVNPAHLEAVPPRENWARGFSPGSIAANTDICQRGHEFTPENTYYRPDDSGHRQCRECIRMRSQRQIAKRKAARAAARMARSEEDAA